MKHTTSTTPDLTKASVRREIHRSFRAVRLATKSRAKEFAAQFPAVKGRKLVVVEEAFKVSVTSIPTNHDIYTDDGVRLVEFPFSLNR